VSAETLALYESLHVLAGGDTAMTFWKVEAPPSRAAFAHPALPPRTDAPPPSQPMLHLLLPASVQRVLFIDSDLFFLEVRGREPLERAVNRGRSRAAQ
jgi:hypothetical protein